jgi:hypothetical protein
MATTGEARMALTGRFRLLSEKSFPRCLLVHEYFVARKNLDVELRIFQRFLAIYDVNLSVLPG